jgi:hypothetical protein
MKLKITAAIGKKPTQPSQELLDAIENRKANPKDMAAFIRLFDAIKADYDAVSGNEGCWPIMQRLGILDSDINPLLGMCRVSPEGKHVNDYYDKVNKEYDEKKQNGRLEKYGPELVSLVKQVYKFAEQPENYENGWDYLAETWDFEEMADFLEKDSCKSLEEAVEKLKEFVRN